MSCITGRCRTIFFIASARYSVPELRPAFGGCSCLSCVRQGVSDNKPFYRPGLGIKGSLAGTALRKSFSQFAKVKVQDQLKAVGVETVDANGNLRKMADIMADVGRVMNSLPTAERIAFAEDIFDIRGSLAGLSLGGNTKDFDAFIAKLQPYQQSSLFANDSGMRLNS